MIERLATIAEIETRSRAFEQAYVAGNARALVEDYFVPDALAPRAVPPGSPPVVGRAALIAMFGGMFADTPAIRLETIDVTTAASEAERNVALELGRAHLSMADGSVVVGRYVVCWIRTGEGWRASTDFFAGDGWDD